MIKGIPRLADLALALSVLKLGNIGEANRNFIETDDPDNWPASYGYTGVGH